MSYIVRDDPPQRARGLLLAAVGVAGVLIAAVAALLVWAAGTGEPERPQVSWSVVGTQPVPSSRQHGPARTGDGLASGFTHDELGAALAAMHITARLTPAVPPVVYQTTARAQCYGDIDAYLERIDRSRRAQLASRPTAVGRELYYRVVDGDPRGGTVRISLAAVTEEARQKGGYAELTRTLQWIDGDWKMQLPPTPRAILPSLDGYSPLEPDDA
ncbi:MAG: hypothetical protein AB7H43_15540 [Acidimicrobiia bacterium]